MALLSQLIPISYEDEFDVWSVIESRVRSISKFEVTLTRNTKLENLLILNSQSNPDSEQDKKKKNLKVKKYIQCTYLNTNNCDTNNFVNSGNTVVGGYITEKPYLYMYLMRNMSVSDYQRLCKERLKQFLNDRLGNKLNEEFLIIILMDGTDNSNKLYNKLKLKLLKLNISNRIIKLYTTNSVVGVREDENVQLLEKLIKKYVVLNINKRYLYLLINIITISNTNTIPNSFHSFNTHDTPLDSSNTSNTPLDSSNTSNTPLDSSNTSNTVETVDTVTPVTTVNTVNTVSSVNSVENVLMGYVRKYEDWLGIFYKLRLLTEYLMFYELLYNNEFILDSLNTTKITSTQLLSTQHNSFPQLINNSQLCSKLCSRLCSKLCNTVGVELTYYGLRKFILYKQLLVIKLEIDEPITYLIILLIFNFVNSVVTNTVGTILPNSLLSHQNSCASPNTDSYTDSHTGSHTDSYTDSYTESITGSCTESHTQSYSEPHTVTEAKLDKAIITIIIELIILINNILNSSGNGNNSTSDRGEMNKLIVDILRDQYNLHNLHSVDNVDTERCMTNAYKYVSFIYLLLYKFVSYTNMKTHDTMEKLIPLESDVTLCDGEMTNEFVLYINNIYNSLIQLSYLSNTNDTTNTDDSVVTQLVEELECEIGRMYRYKNYIMNYCVKYFILSNLVNHKELFLQFNAEVDQSQLYGSFYNTEPIHTTGDTVDNFVTEDTGDTVEDVENVDTEPNVVENDTNANVVDNEPNVVQEEEEEEEEEEDWEEMCEPLGSMGLELKVYNCDEYEHIFNKKNYNPNNIEEGINVHKHCKNYLHILIITNNSTSTQSTKDNTPTNDTDNSINSGDTVDNVDTVDSVESGERVYTGLSMRLRGMGLRICEVMAINVDNKTKEVAIPITKDQITLPDFKSKLLLCLLMAQSTSKHGTHSTHGTQGVQSLTHSTHSQKSQNTVVNELPRELLLMLLRGGLVLSRSRYEIGVSEVFDVELFGEFIHLAINFRHLVKINKVMVNDKILSTNNLLLNFNSAYKILIDQIITTLDSNDNNNTVESVESAAPGTVDTVQSAAVIAAVDNSNTVESVENTVENVNTVDNSNTVESDNTVEDTVADAVGPDTVTQVTEIKVYYKMYRKFKASLQELSEELVYLIHLNRINNTFTIARGAPSGTTPNTNPSTLKDKIKSNIKIIQPLKHMINTVNNENSVNKKSVKTMVSDWSSVCRPESDVKYVMNVPYYGYINKSIKMNINLVSTKDVIFSYCINDDENWFIEGLVINNNIKLLKDQRMNINLVLIPLKQGHLNIPKISFKNLKLNLPNHNITIFPPNQVLI